MIGQTQEMVERGSFVGTIFYIAPEMINNQQVDFGTDLWALGIIIYRLYTGKFLFADQSDYVVFEKIK
jgi:serine/threonine protein kinase